MKLTYDKKRNIFLTILAILVLLILIIGIILLMFSIYGPAMLSSQSVQDKKAQAYALQKDTTTKNGVVFLGDSIMEMYKLDEFFPNKNYINRGIGSNESKDILKRLQNNVIDLDPSVVFIHVGTNDIGHGVDKHIYLNNMNDIIKQLKESLPSTKILVDCIYPTVELENIQSKKLAKCRPNTTIVDINNSLKNLCKSYEITFVDSYNLLLKDQALNKNYTIDGLHLNSNGYAIISKEIEKHLA